MTIKNISYEKCTSCSFPVNELNAFTIDLDLSLVNGEESPSCQQACPAGVNIRGYIYLLRNKRLEEAIQVLRESLPFPAITGHICFHPCEYNCARRDVDQPVNINALERFMADYWLNERASLSPKQYQSKIAIIGAGPAGLSAAYFLNKMGYTVTVFEAMSEAGGMLRYGIPRYRLPRDILESQLKYIQDMGVELRCGQTFDKDFGLGELRSKGYQSILIACGAGESLKLGIDGEELMGVYSGLDILRKVSSGEKVEVGKKVVVIGGGNVAIDSARTAVRLGAKETSLIYRRSSGEMPAYREGVKAAKAEGVKIDYLVAPVGFTADNGRMKAVECIRMELGEADASGRRAPVPVRGSEFSFNADTVVVAIGEYWNKSRWERSSGKRLKLNRESLATGIAGVFICGDAILGPSSVVEAIASGRKAAAAIDGFLRGIEVRSQPLKKVEEYLKDGVEKKPRNEMASLSPALRKHSFSEVKSGFTAETAEKEARRCMACGVRGNCTEVCPMDVLRMDESLHKPVVRYPEDCMTCYNCEFTCPMSAITVDPIKKPITPVIDYSSGARK